MAYEQAEANYRAAVAEVDRIFISGGAQSATTRLKNLTAGPYLKFQTSEIQSARIFKLQTTGHIKISMLQRSGYSASSLLLKFCEDASGVVQKDPRRGSAKGLIAVVDVESRKLNGVWKVWEAKYTVVKSCDGY